MAVAHACIDIQIQHRGTGVAFVGRFMGRVDARWFASAAFLIFSVSYFMRARYTADADFWALLMLLMTSNAGGAIIATCSVDGSLM